MSDPQTVQLGKKYKDTITNFTGVAVARTEYLYGCVRVILEGPGGSQNELKAEYFDEQRLVTVEDEPVSTTARTGGSQRAVTSRDGR